MKAYATVGLISLAMLTSATNIAKARQASPPISYSVGILESDGTSTSLPSENGVVYQSFDPTTGPYLTHAEIDNGPGELATCVARDQWGSQVSAFGGSSYGGVESFDFVAADGKQIFSLTCNLV